MKRIILFLAAVSVAIVSFGQQQPQQLPNDPAVRVGKLDNGLTYYIRHNDKPEGRAEFYLATNVGAIQETPDQDGLAHFLEHMCFNGTKNLPGKTMLDYLQKIGAEFGRNINASTGVETTQYMLNNIPVAREGIIDTCLLIMHDYSHFVTLDPVEIDKERGVIIEEKRSRNSASWRMFEKSLPYYYGDSKYSTCTLIGSQENLETFKPESIENFYRTWYRPDMQAVIVVGDIDVDQIESKIKTLFSDIPAAVNPQPKEMHMIPDNDKPVVGIITDPEANSTEVEVIWKGEPTPEELNSTDIGMLMDLIKNYVYFIMAERFGDISADPASPFIGANLGLGKFTETCEVVMGNVACRNGEALDGLRAFLTEVKKMQLYGFTDAEVGRARDQIISYYEKAAEGADTRQNSEFVRPLISNFFDNTTYMEPAKELEYARMFCSQINAQLLNQMVSQLIPANNMILVYKAPEKDGLSHPAEADFLAVIDEVAAAEVQKNAEEVSNEPLLDPAALKGSPVRKEKKSVYGSTEWILKNGLKVIVLPTEHKKDQVIFSLEKNGGKTLVPTEDIASFDENIFTLFQNNSGVSKFPLTQLSKMLAGKTVGVSPFISNVRHGVTGSCSPKDIETAFQLMYLYFMEPRFDTREYDNAIRQINTVLPNIVSQPDFIFQKEYTRTMYGDNPRVTLISEEVIEKASLASIERVYRELFNDVAGATLYIVGNVDLATLKPMVEKYAGSLPKGRKATEWLDNSPEIVKGKVENVFETKMQTPMETVLQIYTAYLPFTTANEVNLSAAQYILDMIYTETLREEEGGTYGASASFGVQRIPVERVIAQVYFNTNPDKVDKLRQLAVDGIMKLANEGPTVEQTNMAVENLKKNIPESRISNGYWLGRIKYYNNYGVDEDKAYEAAVDAITPDSIRAAVKAVVEQGNFIEVVMGPENQ